MNRHPAKPPVRREQGFALLITITLLAFLVLLLVSLASLTRVETQVAANSQQLGQARQNALMALNIAIGQLQKYAGPDQRTTARADLENGPGKSSGMWTGAYGSSVAADYTDTPSAIQSAVTASANVNTYGSSARLLNWLVSGNEAAAFNPVWGTGDVGTKGQIVNYPDPTSTTAVPFKPTGTITNLTATTAANDTSLTITNAAGTAKPARLLVGQNSVTSSVDTASKPIDYVVAPTVDINAASGTVPGISGTPTIGRYAWWVGDEGVKARINLPLAGTDPSLSSTDSLAQKQTAFTNASRAAVELMSKDTPGWATPTLPALNAARIDTLYDPSFSTTSKIVVPDQSALASTNNTAMATALKYRFHDVTTRSYSVLSDTYAGGLKQDLTRILANPALGPTGTDSLWKTVNSSEDTTFIPNWSHLRSFYATTATNGKITSQLPSYGNGTAGSVGVSPVLTYAALGFRYSTAAVPADGVPINLNIYPIAVLWNPYANTLAGQTYEVGIRFVFQGSHAGLTLSVNMGDDTTPDWQVKEIRDLGQSGATFPIATTSIPTGNPIQFFRFKVTCPDLAPGESRVFTLSSQASSYTPGQNNLAPGFDFDRYVSLSSTTITAAEVGKKFKLTPFSGSVLKAGVGSETGAYLGDGTAPPISTTGAWDPALNHWYQSIQRVDYQGITDSYTDLQGPELLRAPVSADKPAAKVLFMCTFSGIGRGWNLNANAAESVDNGKNIPNTRWIAQGNIRANYAFRTIRDPNYAAAPYYARAGKNDGLWPIWFFENPTDSTRASSGLTLDKDPSSSGTTSADNAINATLFEFRDGNLPLTSIGQLQQANLSLAGAYPGYPIGNSLADYRLPNTANLSTNGGVSWTNQAAVKQPVYYDISWLLNRTLWDRYYFSAVKTDGTFENPRNIAYQKPGTTASDVSTDLQDYQKAANRLIVAGGFNINSTSEQAWRAVLGGANQLAYNPLTSGTSSTALGVSLSRFGKPTGGTDIPSNVSLDSTFSYARGNNLSSLWQGYRVLSADEIAQLTRNIVDQIRTRGPFTSLSDFINRRVIDNSAFINAGNPAAGAGTPATVKSSLTPVQIAQFTTALKGTLQAAIDATTASVSGSAYAINDGNANSYWLTTRTVSSLPFGNQGYYSLVNARGDTNAPTSGKTPMRNSAAFAPKYLTQGDILSNIGAGLSARSDTFTIRTYGETVNPVTQSIDGRAWCEAVVQRLPDYVESAVSPEATPTSGSLSEKFGRKFKIISFRWLSPNDI
ncbi:MAG: hypothetical protein WC205_00025 [Opitutaceae bacterium]|jgi:hypothetical protein